MHKVTSSVQEFCFVLVTGIGIFCLLFVGHPAFANDPSYAPLEAWQGEYLPQGYGAFYIRFKLQDFKKSVRGNSFTTNVFLHFHDERSARRFVVSQAAKEGETGVQVWKMPIGNYILHKVSLADNIGRLRSWQTSTKGPLKAILSVRYLFLSNLGMMTISPLDKAGLSLRIQPQPNAFKNTYRHEAFAGVVDGTSLKVQERLGGKNLFSEATGDFSTGDEVRAAFSYQRQIMMVYKLDIGRQRTFTTKLINTLASQDLDLRRCYMEELEKSPNLKGNVGFNFVIDRGNGAMQKIQYRGGNIKNNRLVTCLYYTLGKMQFPVAATIPGNIVFYFSYREDQGRAAP